MSIDNLKLVSVIKLMDGGSTKPLLIEAENNQGEISRYVVKLFKTKNTLDNYPLVKEILANELAKSFELPVADYGLIDIPHELLKDHYPVKEIAQLDKGYKFCSKLKEGVFIYNNLISNGVLKDYHIENVFAFDNIILNIDRGGFRNKSNLLINDSDYLLIDHELSLPFYDKKHKHLNIDYKNKFNSYFFKNHIFYNLLRKKRKKETLFQETIENLRSLNPNTFSSIFDDLDEFNIEYGNKNISFAYLDWCKANRQYIVTKLLERIL